MAKELANLQAVSTRKPFLPQSLSIVAAATATLSFYNFIIESTTLLPTTVSSVERQARNKYWRRISSLGISVRLSPTTETNTDQSTTQRFFQTQHFLQTRHTNTNDSGMADDKPSNVEATLISQNLDQILSGEMESLSFKDRNLIQEEIHGVTNLCPEENPQMIQQALREMQDHIDKIENKTVYNQISPFSYIHTDTFRLRFLRCELYDCKKAAERLLKFTEYMNEEFDMEVLERPLMLTDLQTKGGKRGKEIMDFFKQGYTQLLPFRDRSGRRVLATNTIALPFDPVLRVCIGLLQLDLR